MKRFLFVLLLLLVPCSLWAQTPANILAQPEATSVAPTDMMYIVIDPSGTPADRKITVGNLASGLGDIHSDFLNDDHTQYPLGTVAAGNPSAGSVPRGLSLFGDSTTGAERLLFGLAPAGNFIDVATTVDGPTSVCFNADCEFFDGYANSLVFTSAGSTVTGSCSSSGSAPTKTLACNLEAAAAPLTLSRFRPANNEPPATLFATYSTRNSHPILQFVDGSDTSAVFSDTMARHYLGGNLNVRIRFTSTVASANPIGWCAAFETISAGTLDIDGNNFNTAQCVSQAAQATSGMTAVALIPFTNAQADAITGGNGFRLKITRDGDGSSVTDSNTGTGEILFVEVYQ